jgi:hypothetical protein
MRIYQFSALYKTGFAQNGIFGILPQKQFYSSDFSRLLPQNLRLKPLLQEDFLSYAIGTKSSGFCRVNEQRSVFWRNLLPQN